MSYDVEIRRNADGLLRRCAQDLEWEPREEDPEDARADPEPSRYWWVEGNMACDCNRRSAFQRAGGVGAEPEAGEGCGHEAYAAVRAILPDGREIPLDGWDDPPEGWLDALQPIYLAKIEEFRARHVDHALQEKIGECDGAPRAILRCDTCLTRAEIACRWWGSRDGGRVVVYSRDVAAGDDDNG